MEFLVPFDARAPKTRLSPLLSADERTALATAMLADVVEAIDAAGHEPRVLATDHVECDAPVEVADRALTPTVAEALADHDYPVAVAMADLPLVDAAALDRLVAPDADVVLAPGLGGGTNALVVRADGFRVDFHGVSVRDHRAAAAAADLSLATVDSFRLALDVDEPGDVVEVLLHGEGETATWLREAGFTVEAVDGRATVGRDGENAGQQG